MHPTTPRAKVTYNRCCQKEENVWHTARPGGEAPLHIKAVLPHSSTLPQECARIGQHHAVVGQREHLQLTRPDVAVLPPARLLPSEDRTPYRLPPSLAPLVGGGRRPEGQHLNPTCEPPPPL
eukprot:8690692-Pyramimonas_sp.AAC.1